MASFSIKIKAYPPVAFLLVLLQLQAVALAAEASSASGGEQPEFDYFLFALQWPATFCRNQPQCCPENGCCRGAESPTEFTIHGLWPQYNDEGWPSCCTDESFNETQIVSLSEDIQKHWPTFQCASTTTCHETNGSFWAHEYEKHGSCAAPVIVGEYDFFSAALTLFSNYNVTRALADAGIVANSDAHQEYPIEDVIAAVRVALHANPKLICAENGFIQDLWLCFHKDFQPRDCDPNNSSCPTSVKLPTYVPQEPKKVEGANPWMGNAEAIM